MNGRRIALALTLALAASLPAAADDAAAPKAEKADKKSAGKKDKAEPAPAEEAPSPVNLANVERTYLERAAISGADANCNIFTEGERFALRSGLYQTEGELLRHGYAPSRIAELAGQVRAHAKSLGCEHPSVVQVAGTIRSAYRQFAKTNWLEYPAQRSTWGASRSEHDKWAVSQADKASAVTFGLRRYSKNDIRLAVTVPARGRAASAVQLLARDPSKGSEPWLGSLLGASTELAAPPRAISSPVLAGVAKKEQDSVGDPVFTFYFSASATARMEMLDPRETVQIELQPSPLDKNAKAVRVLFEVGDIRAAHAFVRIPPLSTAAGPAPAAH